LWALAALFLLTTIIKRAVTKVSDDESAPATTLLVLSSAFALAIVLFAGRLGNAWWRKSLSERDYWLISSHTAAAAPGSCKLRLHG
jgi:hypothetical protein